MDTIQRKLMNMCHSKHTTLIRKIYISFLFSMFCFSIFAQKKSVAYQQSTLDSSYTNPVIHKDYSDPDVIRVNDTYIMTASSFNHTPGLPILISKDLVHWTLVSHALQKLVPEDYFKTVRHGCGVWAPAIRFHNNEYYIYYPDPDYGIYVVKAKNYIGPWSEPELVMPGKGLIDPCPFWDTGGKAYMIHAYAGSRASIKSILSVVRLNQEGTRPLDGGRIVYDGHLIDPTIEGPKLYKRNNYYYIFAPAGGVSTGWQTVLRSKNIYGPFERKVVMAQGKTKVNGPHQGAWVDGKDGKDWFVHFQDKGAYGRIVHLQPMRWKNDWPVIGRDDDGDGTGEPMYNAQAASDTFKYIEPHKFETIPNPEWQWQANFSSNWYFLHDHQLRLFAHYFPEASKNKYNLPNIIMQKFPAEQFEVSAKVNFQRMNNDEDAGMMVFGYDYCWLGIQKRNNISYLTFNKCINAETGASESTDTLVEISQPSNSLFFKMKVKEQAICEFSYSFDGEHYQQCSINFKAREGKWVGAKFGFFATRLLKSNDCGAIDIESMELRY